MPVGYGTKAVATSRKSSSMNHRDDAVLSKTGHGRFDHAVCLLAPALRVLLAIFQICL
jgi:hypothetical protein